MRISDWSLDVCSSDLSRKGDEGVIEGRPGAYSGWSYFRLWLDGNEPAAPAHRCAGSLYPRMSALRRNGTCPYRLLRRAIGASPPGGRGGAWARQSRHAARQPGSGFLCPQRSEEHTSELQSLMRTSYAVFCF